MKVYVVTTVLCITLLAGCSSVILKEGDFSWPVESVLTVDKNGMVEDKQYFFSFNVKELLFAETQDSVNVTRVSLRIIRDKHGYFLITAKDFKNVYVFQQAESSLKLRNKFLVSNTGLTNPAFNQRPPYIQLLDEPNPSCMLTKDGISAGENK